MEKDEEIDEIGKNEGNKLIELVIPQNQTSIRIDAYITSLLPEQSKTFLKKLIKKGNVLIDSIACTKPSKKIRPGETIRIQLEDNEGGKIQKMTKSETGNDYSLIIEKIIPQDIKLDILHEDQDIIVLVKQKGSKSYFFLFENNFLFFFSSKKKKGMV